MSESTHPGSSQHPADHQSQNDHSGKGEHDPVLEVRTHLEQALVALERLRTVLPGPVPGEDRS